jgi:ribosomal protein L11 methyltransferase
MKASNLALSATNTKENITENHCIRVVPKKIDKIPGDPQFDIILANINKHVLLGEMAEMGQQLRVGGVILMSDLLHEDFEEIEIQALLTNLSVSERTSKGSWICLKMEKVQIK